MAQPELDRRRLLALAAQAAVAGALPRSAWGAPPLRHNPFGLGVASGDPMRDGFVLWTRLLGAGRVATSLEVGACVNPVSNAHQCQ